MVEFKILFYKIKIDKYYWKFHSKITIISYIKFKFKFSLSNFIYNMLFSRFSWLLDYNLFLIKSIDKYQRKIHRWLIEVTGLKKAQIFKHVQINLPKTTFFGPVTSFYTFLHFFKKCPILYLPFRSFRLSWNFMYSSSSSLFDILRFLYTPGSFFSYC